MAGVRKPTPRRREHKPKSKMGKKPQDMRKEAGMTYADVIQKAAAKKKKEMPK